MASSFAAPVTLMRYSSLRAPKLNFQIHHLEVTQKITIEINVIIIMIMKTRNNRRNSVMHFHIVAREKGR